MLKNIQTGHSKVYNLLLLDLFMHDAQPKRGQMAELNDKVSQQADKIIRSHLASSILSSVDQSHIANILETILETMTAYKILNY